MKKAGRSKKLGITFKKRMAASGFITQNAIADVFGLTQRCISYYISGGRKIPDHIWKKLEEIEGKKS